MKLSPFYFFEVSEKEYILSKFLFEKLILFPKIKNILILGSGCGIITLRGDFL